MSSFTRPTVIIHLKTSEEIPKKRKKNAQQKTNKKTNRALVREHNKASQSTGTEHERLFFAPDALIDPLEILLISLDFEANQHHSPAERARGWEKAASVEKQQDCSTLQQYSDR